MTSHEFVWQPDEAIRRDANLTRFMRALGVADFDALNALANADPAGFHDRLIRHIDFRFYTPYERVLDLSEGLPFAKWCVGGTTNVVLNCLDVRRGTSDYGRIALEWEGEDGARTTWAFADLDREVCRFAWGLRRIGLAAGDVIGMYLPNLPQAVVALLAIAKIGAIVVPLFSGFGAEAIAQRLQDSGAAALVTVDGSLRRGRFVAAKAIADAALATCPGVIRQIVFAYAVARGQVPAESTHGDRPDGDRADRNLAGWVPGRDQWWHELVQDAPEDPAAVATEAVAADAPFMLVYTSGTTGRPKGVVHSHCGFPIKTVLDIGLCMDLKPSDRILWMSDMGWLVGPILVFGGLLIGATVVLIEGAPGASQPGWFWRLVERHRVSYLGIAPTMVRSLMPAGSDQFIGRDLSSLRLFVSTGEAWTPDAWNWLFTEVGRRRLPILNYSGGTEMGGILIGTVLHPLKPCAFAGPVPGTGAAVVDEAGNPVPAGSVGELVMRTPTIGLTRGLWRDRERYLETYWRKLPDTWVHGDFASIDADGMWYVHGRSDDTLKIAGKRTGPAEIEALLSGTGLLVEAAAIGVPHAIKGSAIVCVCVARPGIDEAAAAGTLEHAVVAGLGVPFRPERIVFVPDLPMTRNMKIMRRVIRAAWLGESAGDLSTLVNPESIDAILDVRRRS